MKEQQSNKKLGNKQKDDEKENAEQQQRRCTVLDQFIAIIIMTFKGIGEICREASRSTKKYSTLPANKHRNFQILWWIGCYFHIVQSTKVYKIADDNKTQNARN